MAAKNTCADCRHFTRESGWCSVYAKWVSRFAARCDYGALCSFVEATEGKEGK